MSRNILLTAALLFAFSGAAESLAQFGAVSFAQPAFNRRFPNQRPHTTDEDEDDDSGDMDEAMMMGYRGMRGGQQDADPALRPKTDLGKRLIQQDYTRSPQTVLAARASIAAKARLLAIQPVGPPKPEGAIAPDAADGEGAPMGDDAMPAGMGDMMQMDSADAMRAMLMQRMGSMGMPPGGATPPDENAGDTPPPGDGAPDVAATPTSAAAAKAKAAETARQKALQAARIADQAERFRLMVVSGDWPAMGAFLKNEAKSDAVPVYAHILSTLAGSDSALVPDEVLAISEAAPGPLDDKLISRLGAILKAVHRRGTEAGAVAVKIRRGTTHFGGTDPENRKRAASLLVAAGLTIEAVEYLAPIEQARAEADADLLNLHATYYRALARTQKGAERQESSRKGWQICRELLNLPFATPEQRTKALTTALSVLSEVPGDDADAWLTSLFQGDPDIGWRVIDKVNSRALNLRMRQGSPDERLKALMLVQRLGKAIMASAPSAPGSVGPNVQTWRAGLDMLTLALIDEAEFTRNQSGQPNHSNEYGGYNPYGGYGGQQQFQPIPAEQLATVLPDAHWLAAIDPGLAAKLEVMVAATAGGSGDAAAVLEMIRPIAGSDPKRAVKLAEALLSGWANFVKPGGSNDDPYSSNPYAYRRYYGGYNPYGGGYTMSGAIPLTRARQQRNLEKLGMVLSDLRLLNVGPIPPKSIVDAFAISHSDAEVFRPEDIETVLGPLDQLAPESRLKLAEVMRQRLGTLWRRPQVQQEAGTKRTDVELAAEVNRGYALAASLLGGPPLRGGSGSEESEDSPRSGEPPSGPESWAAACLSADLSFDHAEFIYGQKAGEADMARYTSLRDGAFATYKRAATLYASALGAGKIQPSARVFVQWFSSSLGASDLGYLTRQDRPDLNQGQQVLAAIKELPGGEAVVKKHIGLFATQTTQAMREMNPELKPRFARHAAEVVGDHPDGANLRRTLTYYDDLIKEIELSLTVDGSTDVGSKDAFGAQLAIWATRNVSREGGGFSKYLRNEQWNPINGQPINYKDDLEKKLRETLSEKFEVVSITFHKPEVQPMGMKRQGWEQFPLAYLLLKARDAAVDRIPPMQLDMDFADGQGTVILPVTSSVALISAKDAAPRPAATGIEAEQILDDRRFASDGTISLEIRAKGKGQLPALASLLSLAPPAGFDAPKIDDHGANITELDTSGSDVVPVTEHSWSLQYKPTGSARPTSFTYPALTMKDAKLATKRYTDADIEAAAATVSITPPRASASRIAVIVGGAVAVFCGLMATIFLSRRKSKAEAPPPAFTIPAHVTPVNTIGLLRRILALNGEVLPHADQQRLATDIDALEKRYFAPTPDGSPPTGGAAELRNTLELWVARANR